MDRGGMASELRNPSLLPLAEGGRVSSVLSSLQMPHTPATNLDARDSSQFLAEEH